MYINVQMSLGIMPSNSSFLAGIQRVINIPKHYIYTIKRF